MENCMRDIIENIELLELDNRKKVLQFLIAENIKIAECARGSLINLDRLTDETIINLDKLIKSLGKIPDEQKV
jgi:hypothetical protein